MDVGSVPIDAGRWERVRREVGRCHVTGENAFHASVAFWLTGFLQTGTWTRREEGDLADPLDLCEGGALLVTGDCRAPVRIGGGALVFVFGDLLSRLEIKGHCEVVIGGGVAEAGSVEGSGIVSVYVDGDVLGAIRNEGSSRVWIGGDLRGEVLTGTPATNLSVRGDLTGTVRPHKPALLYLEVGGFMPTRTIEDILSYRYTDFAASLGASDQPAGLHSAIAESLGGRAFVVVHEERAEPGKRGPRREA